MVAEVTAVTETKVYPKKNCIICGQDWQPANMEQSRRTTMCSKECRKVSRKVTYPVKVCAVCLCEWQPTTPHDNQNKTCSRECLKASRRKQFVKTCPECLNEWHPENAEKNKLQNCSKECSLAARKKIFAQKVKVEKFLPLKECTVCSKEWQPRNRYQSARNIACSKDCANTLVSKANTGRVKLDHTRITITCPCVWC